jgi:AcrR family transcriptional regulator
MGKTRKITTDDVLDAAERVAIRLGAAGLSIDEVAKDAGISKSRVVYDFKSKSALLTALVERRLRIDSERIASCVASESHTANPALFGRIQAAAQAPTDIERAAALAICTASAHDGNVQALFRDMTAKDLSDVKADPKRPRASLMTYLAFYGLMSMEYLDFRRWSEDERNAILDEIRKIYDSFPEPVSVS